MMDWDIFRNLFFALLHSIWLGLVIAGGLALYLRGCRPDRVQQRYAVACLALLALVLAMFVTWAVLEYKPVTHTAPPSPAKGKSMTPMAAEPDPLRSADSTPDTDSSPIISVSADWPLYGLSAWALGVVLMLWRFMIRISVSKQLCCHSQAFESPEIVRLVARLWLPIDRWDF